ncbi:hypothetical protein DYB32_006359 [Aphanomyces invadans]|uniref:EamA domain-containing protein n=1 Tax=Aphanomyces invadans TaxID=157072 RepID=A0A418ARS5_9STRA|nr:hypothetical protein DYB32_006359 [Aphanomyces invadans]
MSPVGRGALSTTCSSPSKYRRSNLPFAFHCKVERIRQRTGSLYGLALIAGGNVIFSFMAVRLSGMAATPIDMSLGADQVCGQLLDLRGNRVLAVDSRPRPERGMATPPSVPTQPNTLVQAIQLRLKISPFAVAPEFRKLLVCRAVIGYIAMALSFYAYSTMILSEAQVILCASPLVTFVLGLSIPTDPAHVLTVLGIGILGCVGQIMITKGLQIEKAGIGSAMMYINILCVMVWDVTLLGETLHAWSVLGAAIICTAAFTIAYRKARRRSN